MMESAKKKAMTVTKKGLNSGVSLLLERMKTNPEEFTVGDKWLSLIKQYRLFLNEEDRNALEARLNELMQQKFTQRVLEELVNPKEKRLKELLLGKENEASWTVRGHYETHIEALKKLHEPI